MKPKRRLYVLWYQYGESAVGWPTMNTTKNVFTKHSEANNALTDYNKRWPENKKEISIKIFEEVSK